MQKSNNDVGVHDCYNYDFACYDMPNNATKLKLPIDAVLLKSSNSGHDGSSGLGLSKEASTTQYSLNKGTRELIIGIMSCGKCQLIATCRGKW